MFRNVKICIWKDFKLFEFFSQNHTQGTQVTQVSNCMQRNEWAGGT